MQKKQTTGTIIQHLIELKKAIMPCIYFTIAATCICYYYSDQIIYMLIRPLYKIPTCNIVAHTLTETFFTYLNIALISAIACSTPFYFIKIYSFIAPGLVRTEKTYIMLFTISFVCLFLTGCTILLYFVLPHAISFLIEYQLSRSIPIVANITIGNYINFTLKLLVAFGISFQTPLMLVLLAKVGIINVHQLRNFRKYSTVIIFTISAIITPPDIPSQISLSLALMALYEISILIISRTKTYHKYIVHSTDE